MSESIQFEPALDIAAVDEMERVAREDESHHGINHRIALNTLAPSSDELLQGFNDDPEAAPAIEKVVEVLGQSIKYMESELEVFSVAHTRLLLVLREHLQIKTPAD